MVPSEGTLEMRADPRARRIRRPMGAPYCAGRMTPDPAPSAGSRSTSAGTITSIYR